MNKNNILLILLLATFAIIILYLANALLKCGKELNKCGQLGLEMCEQASKSEELNYSV